jgi:hypothetical protein
MKVTVPLVVTVVVAYTIYRLVAGRSAGRRAADD